MRDADHTTIRPDGGYDALLHDLVRWERLLRDEPHERLLAKVMADPRTGRRLATAA